MAAPLRLFLTLTNLNGMPYRIDFGSMTLPDGSTVILQQSYVDACRLSPASPRSITASRWPPARVRPDEFVIGFENAPNTVWGRLTDFGQYAPWAPRRFRSGCRHAGSPSAAPLPVPAEREPPPVPPVPPDGAAFWPLVPDWDALQDLVRQRRAGHLHVPAVDGGMCDNEPIELARTALAGITGENPRDGKTANRAVLLIDPFAGSSTMAKPLAPDVLTSAGALLATVLQQIRYDTRDILLAANADVFSRFMITAQRGDAVGDYALATAGLDAFMGFASPVFRRHDYLLGRKNCQDYLRRFLVLPDDNKLFAGWSGVPGLNIADYRVTDASGAVFLPIIPLTGATRLNEVLDPWPAGAFDPNTLRPAIEARFNRLLSAEFAKGPLTDVLTWLAGKIAEGTAADYVIGLMNQALAEWQLNPPATA